MTTNATQPYIGWLDDVQRGTIEKVKAGPVISTGDNHGDLVAWWLGEKPQRIQMGAAYHAGEPSWMIIDEMVLRWYAHRRSLREDADQSALCKAHIASMNVPLAREPVRRGLR